MKRNLITYFIFLLLLTAGIAGCSEESISMDAAKLPDASVMENTAGVLRSMNTLTNKVMVGLTEGDESADEEIYYFLSQPAKTELMVTAIADAKLVEDYNKANNTKLDAFPTENVKFESNGILSVTSTPRRTFCAESLRGGKRPNLLYINKIEADEQKNDLC